MKKTSGTRWLALLLALVMVFSLLSVSAFAENQTAPEEETVSEALQGSSDADDPGLETEAVTAQALAAEESSDSAEPADEGDGTEPETPSGAAVTDYAVFLAALEQLEQYADAYVREHADEESAALAVFGAGHPLQSCAGSDRKGLALGELRQPLFQQEVDEYAHAVAAHLRDTAVTVAVVHEPLCVRVGLQQCLSFGKVLRTHGTDEAVCANAVVAVAHGCHLPGVVVPQPVRIGNQDKVVAGTVSLREGEAGQAGGQTRGGQGSGGSSAH